MSRKNHLGRVTIKALVLTIALLAAPIARAQGTMAVSSQAAMMHRSKAKKAVKGKSFIRKSVDFIEYVLNDMDSTYIVPSRFNLTLFPMYSYRYEHYRFSSPEEQQSIYVTPQSINKIGLYIGWRWLAIGYNFDLQDSRPQTDFNLSLYSQRIGLDLFYRKNSGGYRIRHISGFNENGNPLQEYNSYFDGLAVRQLGFNLYYIFNKRFAYPAAYSHTTRQRFSAGSFILGANYNNQKFIFDHNGLDPKIVALLQPGLKFNELEYNDFSINFGYSYNWVFTKNCLASISITPAVGYKHTPSGNDDSKKFWSHINYDLITRAALVYSKDRFYTGASLVSHSYYYNKDQLSIINGFSIIRVYAGINFWRRK